MSIEIEIQKLETAQKLTFIKPLLPGWPVKRNVFVSDEVHDLINGTLMKDVEYGKVAGQARAKVDGFIGGKSVIFALNPINKDDATLVARNAPVSHGIVDFRIRSPRPSLRIFGAFAKVDLLLLLTWHPREKLNFSREVTRCKSKWDTLFPSYNPLIGQNHADYISGHVLIG